MDPLLLYSANTHLAFHLAERYYKQIHWVWCGPAFDARDSRPIAVPPSSNPAEIIEGLYQDVMRGDRHSTKISDNRAALRGAANERRMQGVITASQQYEITYLIENAELREFRPLLFVIPFSKVRKRVQRISIEEWASPLYPEFVIPDLPRRCFDILELRRI